MSPQGGQTGAAEARPAATWVNKRTGQVRANPSQVDIVRGDVVKSDSDVGKAAVEARRARLSGTPKPARVDTSRDNSQTVPMTETPAKGTRKATAPVAGLTDTQTAALREYHERGGFRPEDDPEMKALAAQGVVTWAPQTRFRGAHWRVTPRGKEAVGVRQPAPATPTTSVDRPRTGTYAGDIPTDRAERLGDKAYTDHIKMLTLVADTGDQARDLGFGPSDQPLQVGDEVMVNTFDRLRRGIVANVTRNGVGNARITYATPSGGYAQETTAAHGAVLQLVDPSRRPRENRAALLPPPAPEARGPRVRSEETKAAVKVAKAEEDKAYQTWRRRETLERNTQRILDDKAHTEGRGETYTPDEVLRHYPGAVEDMAEQLGIPVPRRRADRDPGKLRAAILAEVVRRGPVEVTSPELRKRYLAAAARTEDVRKGRIGPDEVLNVPAAPAAPGPAARPTTPTVPQPTPATPEAGAAQVKDAIGRLTGGNTGQWVSLADLRDATPGISQADFDEAVRHLARTDPGVILEEETNQKTLTERTRGAAVTMGGRTQHVMALQEAPRPRGRAAAPAAPAPVPLGATDAQAAALRPRREGESDLSYSLRTAPSDFAAEQILKGYDSAGLRAIARQEGVTVPSGAGKADLVAAIMRIRSRDRDSQAIDRMTGSTPARPAATPAPATTPNITPGQARRTITGGQLLAERRRGTASTAAGPRPASIGGQPLGGALTAGITNNQRADVENYLRRETRFTSTSGLTTDVTGTQVVRGLRGNAHIEATYEIRDANGKVVGKAVRELHPPGADGSPARADHISLTLDRSRQGNGFAREWNAHMEDVYRANGIREIRLTANEDVGGYAWAKHGYTWADEHQAAGLADRLDAAIRKGGSHWVALRALAERMRSDDPNEVPTPLEIAMAGWTPGAKTWPGKEFMLANQWEGRKVL